MRLFLCVNEKFDAQDNENSEYAASKILMISTRRTGLVPKYLNIRNGLSKTIQALMSRLQRSLRNRERWSKPAQRANFVNQQKFCRRFSY